MERDHLLANIQPRRLKCMNIVIDGRRTSLRMEMDIWEALQDIGDRERLTTNEICTFISHHIGEWRRQRDVEEGQDSSGDSDTGQKGKGGETITLTAAIRVFIMNYFRRLAQGVFQAHEGESHIHFGLEGNLP